jgi:hypothetical protein
MAALIAVAASANANDWGNLAVISDTLGNHAGRICVGEGLRVSDIGCPTYAPSVTTAGDVSVTGNLSANKFIGDGSLLTGVGQADRITSGTLAMTANSDTSYVSLSTIGTTWGYFSSGASYLPHLAATRVSSTNVSTTLLQFGASAVACTNGISGSIRWSAPSATIQVCTGAGWTSLSSGTTGGAGVSALASLTDVQITNIAGRDYLRYDAGASKWVNISESTVMSTTTMVSQFPDAISCSMSGSKAILYADTMPYVGDGGYYYRPAYSSASNDAYIGFNVSGAYGTSHPAMAGSDCLNKSIGQLYAEGKAFNFIGNAAANSGALGDRITSGTLAMVANSATSIVSLSTNGSVWGYLGSVASYLPTITAARVSSTNISTSLIQIGNTGATCTAGISGSLRYSTVSSTMEYCNSTAWVSMGPSATTVPAFAVRKSANQTIAASTVTQLTLPTEDFDTNNNFTANQFTPSVPGYYMVGFSVACDGLSSNQACGGYIRKNGYAIAGTLNRANGNLQVSSAGTRVVWMNGTTDTLDLAALTESASGNILAWDTALHGYLLTAGGSGGGAGADNLGNHTATQNLAMGAFNVVGTGQVSVTNISGTLIQVGGGNGAACDAGRKGAIRYSNVSSTIEYCNSTAWVSMGPSATDAISFRARNSNTQTVTADAYVKMGLGTEIFDTNNNFASGRFTATVPGTYYFSGVVGCQSTVGGCLAMLYLNGSNHLTGTYSSSNYDNNSTVSGLIRLSANDYVELWGRNSGATTMTTGTYLQGFLVGPQNGGAGGGSDNLGNHTATQNLAMGGYSVVGTGQVSVTDISVTHLQLKSPATMACNAGALGTIRFNPTTGAPQICVQR